LNDEFMQKMPVQQSYSGTNDMNIQLPDSIATFFEVSNGADVARLSQCFAQDASVRDEGQTHQGYGAIKSWLQATQRQYEYRVEPVTVQQNINVIAKITGNFPGSPIQLEYVFQLVDDKIKSLEIRS
jgi:hypothetical protein